MAQDKTKEQQNKTRKEGLKSYADITINAIDWFQQCATANFLQLLSSFDISFPLWWPKHIQLNCSRSPHSVLHSNTRILARTVCMIAHSMSRLIAQEKCSIYVEISRK